MRGLQEGCVGVLSKSLVHSGSAARERTSDGSPKQGIQWERCSIRQPASGIVTNPQACGQVTGSCTLSPVHKGQKTNSCQKEAASMHSADRHRESKRRQAEPCFRRLTRVAAASAETEDVRPTYNCDPLGYLCLLLGFARNAAFCLCCGDRSVC